MEASELFQGNYCLQFSAEKHHSLDSNNTNGTGDHFVVEELLNFSNEDAVFTDGAAAFDNVSANSSTLTVVDSCNSSLFSGDNGYRNFSNDLCVPHDDLAELLSNLVEESFSCEDLQKLQLISGMKARSNESSQTKRNSNDNNSVNANPNNQILNPEMAVARSKRPRAATCNWASRFLMVSSTTSSSENIPPPLWPQSKKSIKANSSKKKDSGDEGNGEGRKCLHCATDKTPQWRTGPMGPKTLCNACGVRYKSGRLVPEYRPAASPTFVLTKHSNSHRKVLELRRQKEMQRAQAQQFMYHHNMMFDLSNGDDYRFHTDYLI